MSNLLSPRLQDEDELIRGLQRRNKTSFEKLYNNYSQALYHSILRLLSNEEHAKEVLQDAFVKIWDKFDLYNPSRGRLYTWMHRIARNLALDKMRSREFTKMSVTNSLEITESAFYENRAESQVDSFSDELLSFLTNEQSLVVRLMYFEGYTSEDVSKEYGIPVGTVKSRIRAGLKRLRKLYGLE